MTPDKISNGATEPSRITTWIDNTDYAFDAYGNATSHNIPTSVVINVPTGKAHYFIVTYDGALLYNHGERASGATSFYGTWSAGLLATTTQVGIDMGLAHTGYRQSWDALGGGTNYWRAPYQATWLVRLTEGSHSLTVKVFGYSDNTMNVAHFGYNSLQVMRIL